MGMLGSGFSNVRTVKSKYADAWKVSLVFDSNYYGVVVELARDTGSMTNWAAAKVTGMSGAKGLTLTRMVSPNREDAEAFYASMKTDDDVARAFFSGMGMASGRFLNNPRNLR